MRHVFNGNLWIEARQKQTMERFDRGYVIRVLGDNFGNGLSSFFPLFLRTESQQHSLIEDYAKQVTKPNLSQAGKSTLSLSR